MPPPKPPQEHRHHHGGYRLYPSIAGASLVVFSLLLLFRKLFRRRSSTAVTDVPRQFSYSVLRRATDSFSDRRRLGQGGSGAVYSGSLSLNPKKKSAVAVKVMDGGSLQGEREFQNEILMANKMMSSDRVVKILGFATSRKRRRMCVVYELMSKGNLQECLLHKKIDELMNWNRRFQIAIEIAKGLCYLHHQCDPPVIHGDIKPSNVLLDDDFGAKIGDFGLARLKLVDNGDAVVNIDEERDSINGKTVDLEENASGVESESVATTASVVVEMSPENVRVPAVETSPEVFAAVGSPSEGVESDGMKSGKGKGVSGKDHWWWKQDSAVSGMGKKKDYVKEWIRTGIKKERMNDDWIDAPSSSAIGKLGKKEKKKKKRRLEWWESMEDGGTSPKKEKRKSVREWWKEEYHEELARKRKKKKKKKQNQKQIDMSDDNEENWWPRDDEMYVDKKWKKSPNRSGRRSIDWWLDGLSGDLWRARHTNPDSVSGEIPKSGGISSTPSMRGTVCYIAPEYTTGGDLSEKCDVYSYGVLLLVLVAGRRPLQVTGSTTAEFKTANLVSWARHLARAGNLLDLVDKKVHSMNREQAQLLITIALCCLQRSPACRPSMKEVAGMLAGELDPPQLPVELTSPPSRSRFKSQRKAQVSSS